jgi:hypothetical protein
MKKLSRRQALSSAGGLLAATALARTSFAKSALATAEEQAAGAKLFGKVDHVISIWLGGGMGQIDTFDPKRRGDSAAKKAGSYYDAIDTAVPGVQVCEHLPELAKRMEQVTAVRTVFHDVIDEHAAATNRMHTGRPVSGTTVYPSLGSIVAHQRGPAQEDAPPYVLIGYPNVTRGPGFLGAAAGYLYLTETGRGPAGLSRPDGISMARQGRREQLLGKVRAEAKQRLANDATIEDYDAIVEQSLRLAGPEFSSVFDLSNEPDELRNRYQSEFGQRLLLSRRLLQRGVRFIEVSHNLNFINGTGWDVHNDGILKQHELIRDLDQTVATLMDDLSAHDMLHRTLIVITSEFGRPPQFDGGGGRGHQGSAFTCVLAGGGLKHTGAYGQTDDLSEKIVSQPVSVPDFFATIHASLGIDWAKYLYDGDRPVPVTDNGSPIEALLG